MPAYDVGEGDEVEKEVNQRVPDEWTNLLPHLQLHPADHGVEVAVPGFVPFGYLVDDSGVEYH